MSEDNIISRYWTFRILKWFCPEHLYEEIEGDLIQNFESDVKRYGEKRARRRLLWNVIRFFRPGIITRNRTPSIPMIMISDYLKFSWRNIGRHRLFSFVNIAGLAAWDDGLPYDIELYNL